MAPAMARKIPSLTPRENQVCALVTHGHSNKEIAVELRLAPGTIKEYLAKIYQKLGLHGRTALAVRYVQGASAIKPTRANHPTKNARRVGGRK